MRIHRLTISDFRGVADCTVAFADGVTVVAGRNEVGKSSLMEALRFLRIHKASSRRVELRAVQPVGRDVGPCVTAEISTGQYRLTYSKRWLKSPKTELHISMPRPERLTGDDAHDRFLQIVAATTDDGLLEALEIIQGQSLGQPELAVLPALRRALDGAAGDADTHDGLMAAVEAEYARYFTATGKPTGDYQRAAGQIEQLRAQVAELDQASVAIDSLTETVRESSQAVVELVDRAAEAAAEVAEFERRDAELADLRAQADDARQRAREAGAVLERTQGAMAERVAAVQEADASRNEARRAVAEAALLADRLAAAEDAVAAIQRSEAAEGERLVAARRVVADVEQRLALARQGEEREELRLCLEQLAEGQRAMAEAEKTLARGSVTAAELRQLEELDVQRRLAVARWEASAATMSVTVTGHVMLDGVELPPGEHGPHALTRATTLEVPGQLVLQLQPGGGTNEGEDAAILAEQKLADALASHGAGGLDQARHLAELTAQAMAERDAAAKTIDDALAGRSHAALLARYEALAELAVGESTQQLVEDLTQAREAVVATEEAVVQIERAAAEARQTMTSAQAAWIRRDAEAAGLVSRAEEAERRLVRAREQAADAVLTSAVALAQAEVARCEASRESTAAALEAADAPTHALLLDNARAVVSGLDSALVARRDELTSQRALLADRLSGGVYDQAIQARAELEEAEAAQASRARAAAAAARLRETLRRHKAEAESRYVAPFRVGIEALARPVFGADVQLEVAQDLRLVSRTLGGVTVPFESLSTGAREQLSLLGRLACAELIQPGEGVPVVIDDALGFADPQRLARLSAVLNKVSATAQIIILTSQPDRFRHVGGAVEVTLP